MKKIIQFEYSYTYNILHNLNIYCYKINKYRKLHFPDIIIIFKTCYSFANSRSSILDCSTRYLVYSIEICICLLKTVSRKYHNFRSKATWNKISILISFYNNVILGIIKKKRIIYYNCEILKRKRATH